MLKCKFGLLIQIYKWKIVEICCRSPRGNVDWNTDSTLKWVLGQVVPHAGTWIEIYVYCYIDCMLLVVPHAGTWIEIQNLTVGSGTSGRSPRGNVDWNICLEVQFAIRDCRSPRGNVDWNLPLHFFQQLCCRRSPRGNVDWNIIGKINTIGCRRSFPTRERGLKSSIFNTIGAV